MSYYVLTVGVARAFHCPYLGKGNPPRARTQCRVPDLADADPPECLSADQQALLGVEQAASHDQTMGETHFCWVVRKITGWSARAPGVAEARALRKVRNLTEPGFSR